MKPEPLKGTTAASTPKAGGDVVSEFYTEHPYPPPLGNLDRVRDMWNDPNVHRAEFHHLWPHKKYKAELDVLVAGCGTWQGARFALSHPAAKVTAIDVAPTSLSHTEALKQKYDLTNLEIGQLAIENAAELDHAPYGRTGVTMFQEYCRTLGVDTSTQEIEDLTATLKILPQHHPLVSMFRGARAGVDAGALIDALLNPRDRTYSVPQLFDFLASNEMSFGRWFWQAPYSPRCGALAETPHSVRLAALPERDRYKLVEIWRGMISNHDFVAYRNDAPAGELQVRFDDDSYLNYVPIRRTWTMCVTEAQQIPPGAAGVLINQTHMHPDIFLIVNELEKQIYEAIDGNRSIGAIVESVPDSSPRARHFFEKLSEYDQVVFDTSNAR
jgi:hypothetical protein